MPRARVPHFEMCKVFQREHESKFGGQYFITNLDVKEAAWKLLAQQESSPADSVQEES